MLNYTLSHIFLSISYFPRTGRNKATDKEGRGLLGWGSQKQLPEGLLAKFHPFQGMVPP